LIETHGPRWFGAFWSWPAVLRGPPWGNVASRWLEQKPIEPPVSVVDGAIARLLVVVDALVIALGTSRGGCHASLPGLAWPAWASAGHAGVLGNLFAGLVIISPSRFGSVNTSSCSGVQGQVDDRL